MGLLPKAFAWKNSRSVPVVALAVQVTIILLVDQLVASLESIIAFEMVSYCSAQILEFFAFVRLRQTHPEIDRPVKVGCHIVPWVTSQKHSLPLQQRAVPFLISDHCNRNLSLVFHHFDN